MKQIKFTFLLVVLISMTASKSYAQATQLVIDNQTPGWLSSKISYGDQVTLEELKVSGYLNTDDIDFIITLSTERNLKVLDMEECHLVKSTRIPEDDYETNRLYENLKLRKLITSKYVRYTKNVDDVYKATLYIDIYNKVDSLYLNTAHKAISGLLDSYIKYLNVNEGVTTLKHVKKTFTLPPTITTIVVPQYSSSGDNATVIYSYHYNPEIITFDKSNYTPSYSGKTIYVPAGTKEKYLNTMFKYFKEIIEMDTFEKIEINSKAIHLHVGNAETLTASISPQDAFYNKYNWRSSDESVVSVDQNGNVTGVGYGKANIIVCSDMDETVADTCEVTVYEHTTGVELETKEVEVNIGENLLLTGKTLPENTSDGELTWSSSNESVATVDATGKVSALQLGACTITATAVDGGTTAECLLTVVQPAKEVSLNKHLTQIRVGAYEELKVTISPDNTSNKRVTWESTEANIADVSEAGVVTAKKAGKVYIKATSISNVEAKDSCEVEVLQPVTGIQVNESAVELKAIGEMKQLYATVLPEDASDKTVRWFSSNTAVCTVSDAGFVVATGVGTSVVTVTSTDGGFVAVCIVTVSQTDGILSIELEKLDGTEKIFDVNGKQLQGLQKGMNIILMSDGTTRKVVVK